MTVLGFCSSVKKYSDFGSKQNSILVKFVIAAFSELLYFEPQSYYGTEAKNCHGFFFFFMHCYLMITTYYLVIST